MPWLAEDKHHLMEIQRSTNEILHFLKLLHNIFYLFLLLTLLRWRLSFLNQVVTCDILLGINTFVENFGEDHA